MTTLAICDGRLVDPAAGLDAAKDILLKDGRVAEIAGPGKLKGKNGAEVLDATGLVVAPGLIDIHVHLREPGQGLQGDHRHRNGGGGSGRIHERRRDAEHYAGERLAGDHALDAGAGARRAGARVSHCGGYARIER